MVEVRETMWWLKPAAEPPIWVNSLSWLSRVDETQPIAMAEEKRGESTKEVKSVKRTKEIREIQIQEKAF